MSSATASFGPLSSQQVSNSQPPVKRRQTVHVPLGNGQTKRAHDTAIEHNKPKRVVKDVIQMSDAKQDRFNGHASKTRSSQAGLSNAEKAKSAAYAFQKQAQAQVQAFIHPKRELAIPQHFVTEQPA